MLGATGAVDNLDVYAEGDVALEAGEHAWLDDVSIVSAIVSRSAVTTCGGRRRGSAFSTDNTTLQ